MEPEISQLVRKGLDEILKDFDLVPKSFDLRKSEYRYRLLMV